jgi:hypothetical protein
LTDANAARTAAITIAGKKGWDNFGLPIYYTTTSNVVAASTTHTQKLYSGGGMGLTLNGRSITAGKIALWDIEAVLASHIEFAGDRIEIRDKATLKRGPQNYSLVITGIDGEAAVTSTRIVENDLNLNMIVYPVPAKNEVNIKFELPQQQNVSLRLTNIAGQELFQENSNNFTGSYNIQLNLTTYPAGLYFINIKVGAKTYTQKFICTK